MATWSGWADQLLKAAGLPTSSANVGFMGDWAAHANRPGCARNPVDISHRASGSSNCGSLPNSKQAQRFQTHSSAANAFADQLNLTDYPHLRVALGDSKPYTTSDTAGVSLDLEKWGSTNFQKFYIAQTGAGPGVGSGGGGSASGYAPSTQRGWHDLRNQLHTFFGQAQTARGNFNYALSELPRRRRVRR